MTFPFCIVSEEQGSFFPTMYLIHELTNQPTNQPTNQLTPRSSLETNIRSATQEVSLLFWNPTVHYCVNKNPPLLPILIQINPVHTFPPYFSKIHYNIILPSAHILPSGLFLSGFPTKNFYAFTLFPRTCCMTRLSHPP
jgi:hypothetical protein